MFLNPKKIVEYCDVHHGMKVADIGASIGAYAIPLAERVGGHGKVYAIDIQKDLLAKLRKEAAREKVKNIEIIWGDVEKTGGTQLKDESVDRVFLVNTLFQTEDRDGVIHEIERILKPGGKVIFIDWADTFGGVGPHPSHVIAENDAVNIFEMCGFRKKHAMPAGNHHYGIIFAK